MHYQTAAVDIDGRPGVAFTEARQGVKAEIVVNPHTYRYMGNRYVAVRDYTVNATDGTRKIHKGQVLGWSALIVERVVNKAGEEK